MKHKGRFQGENALLFTSHLGLGNGASWVLLKPVIINTLFLLVEVPSSTQTVRKHRAWKPGCLLAWLL